MTYVSSLKNWKSLTGNLKIVKVCFWPQKSLQHKMQLYLAFFNIRVSKENDTYNSQSTENSHLIIYSFYFFKKSTL